MIDITHEENRQRKFGNRRGGTFSHRQGTRAIVTALCTTCCRMSCYMIANVSYVAFYVVLGFVCGFILLVILNLLSLLNPQQINTNFDMTSAPNTIADALIRQAAKNNKDETSQCVIPLGTTVATIKPNNKNEESFRLVVHNNDFLSSHIVKNGFWEIRSLAEMAALSPSTTMPKSSMALATTATTFYDVGANVGYYSFLFAASGYNVIAFEPEKTNLELFRASMCLNPSISVRIQLYDYIISDTNSDDGAATKDCKLVGRVNSRTKKYLYSIPRLNCDNKYKCIPDQDLICQTNVTVATLDRFVNELHPDVPLPQIIKLDVEGQEVKIIESVFTNNNMHPKRATSQQLQRRIEPLLIQYENRDGRYASTISSILIINGYTVGTKRGHDSNTIAEFQPPKMSKKRP